MFIIFIICHSYWTLYQLVKGFSSPLSFIKFDSVLILTVVGPYTVQIQIPAAPSVVGVVSGKATVVRPRCHMTRVLIGLSFGRTPRQTTDGSKIHYDTAANNNNANNRTYVPSRMCSTRGVCSIRIRQTVTAVFTYVVTNFICNLRRRVNRLLSGRSVTF